MSNEKLTEKTLADVQAGIPARDAEIEALRKENTELREQLEAVGAGGVNGRLMPGVVCLDQVRVVAWRASDGHGLPQTDWIDGDPGEETSAWVGGDIECAYSAHVAAPVSAEPAFYIPPNHVDEVAGKIAKRVDFALSWSRKQEGLFTFPVYLSPVAAQAQPEDDSIALDRLADYIADTWPMDKKYGIEEICQRLHAMWPGEFMPASHVDKSTETQGKPVDESPNLQGQQKPASGADGLSQEAWEEWKSRAAIAQRVASIPAVDKALEVFCNEGTADNAVALVRAVMTALVQLSGNPGQPDHLPDATEMVPGDQFRDAAQMIEPSGDIGDLPANITEALDLMDALLAPERGLLSVPYTSATVTAAREDLALIRAALAQQGANTGKTVSVENQVVTQQDATRADVDIETAAKALAESMDYPWDYMPRKGREHMRRCARIVIDASRKEAGQ